MSFVAVSTDLVSDTAGNLAGIGSTINAANSAAATRTTTLAAAGADEVSAAVAAVFADMASAFKR